MGLTIMDMKVRVPPAHPTPSTVTSMCGARCSVKLVIKKSPEMDGKRRQI